MRAFVLRYAFSLICYSILAQLVKFEVCRKEFRKMRQTNRWEEKGREKNTHNILHGAGDRERHAGRDRGKWLGNRRERRARGHPWVICFGPLRAQTRREQVNQLQCDMNH